MSFHCFQAFEGFSNLEVGSKKIVPNYTHLWMCLDKFFFDNFQLVREIYMDHCLTEKWKSVLA